MDAAQVKCDVSGGKSELPLFFASCSGFELLVTVWGKRSCFRIPMNLVASVPGEAVPMWLWPMQGLLAWSLPQQLTNV